MSPQEPFVLLVNPSAGGGRTRELLPGVQAAMRDRGLAYRVVQTRTLEHGLDEAQAAAKAGEVPVVMSGDGLIGQVGGVLAGSETPLGVIPGGRGNDFARVMGIPTEPERAVDVLAAREQRLIDIGEVNGKRYVCVASCGFDSDANRIANEARLVKGRLVYAYAALRAMATWKPARFVITLDGERREFTGYSVAAANSKAFGGGMFIAPDARLDDGELDVVYITQVGRLHYLLNLPKAFDGSHVRNEEVVVVRGRELTIEADRPFAVYADGEHLSDLPATLRVLESALKVIAPNGRPAT
ncbi:MAG TPA: diacylglycerol kinase family protein [Solirubrobacterales bacterium]|nr:diacylglycerol kinase family protein [Solirubrobacterales bacterium]